ncbi:hypothetical protein D3C77_569820 [compost metagenome]
MPFLTTDIAQLVVVRGAPTEPNGVFAFNRYPHSSGVLAEKYFNVFGLVFAPPTRMSTDVPESVISSFSIGTHGIIFGLSSSS